MSVAAARSVVALEEKQENRPYSLPPSSAPNLAVTPPPLPPRRPSFETQGTTYFLHQTRADGTCGLHALLGVKQGNEYIYPEGKKGFVEKLQAQFNQVKGTFEHCLADMLKEYITGNSSIYVRMIFDRIPEVIEDLRKKLEEIEEGENHPKILQTFALNKLSENEAVWKNLLEKLSLSALEREKINQDLTHDDVLRNNLTQVLDALKGTPEGEELSQLSQQLRSFENQREALFLQTAQLPQVSQTYMQTCLQPGYYFSDVEIGLAAILFGVKVNIYTKRGETPLEGPISYGNEGPTVTIHHQGIHYSRCERRITIEERGFRLQGSLDSTHTFICSFYPSVGETTGWVKNSKKKNWKEIKAIFSPPLTTFEKAAQIFLERQPTVSVACKGLMNKYLEIDLTKASYQYPVKTALLLRGKVEQQECELQVNIFHLTERTAKLNGRVINLEIGPFRDLDVEKIKKLQAEIIHRAEGPSIFLSLPSNQAAGIAPQEIVNDVGVNDPVPLSADNEVSSGPSLLRIQNTSQLIEYLSQPNPDPFAVELAHKMVNIFTREPHPPASFIEEISELFRSMKAETYDEFRILDTLLTNFNERVLKSDPIIQALAEAFEWARQHHYQQLLKAVRKEEDVPLSPFLHRLDPSQLVRVLGILTEHLNSTHHQETHPVLLRDQLRFAISLLDILEIRGVANVQQKEHQAAYDAIRRFANHTNLEIAYLANYGKQAFTLLPDDQSKEKRFATRGYLILKGVAKVFAKLDTIAPWKVISGVVDSLPEFKKAFTSQQEQKDWFLQLLAVRQMVFSPSPHLFLNLLNGLKNQCIEVQKEMDFHEPHFLVGFTDLLWEILHFPQFGEEDIKIKTAALELLGAVVRNNDKWDENLPFSLPDKSSYKKQLHELALSRLRRCTTHPQAEIKEAAKKMLAELPSYPASTSSEKPFRSVSESHELIDEAIKQLPLFASMQRVATRLREDDQLKQEKPYYTPLDAKEGDFSRPEPLKDRLEEFLKGKDSTLLIQGDGGAGKSLAMKVFADDLLTCYHQKEYFPLFVSLPGLRDPVNGAVSETLQPLKIEEEELKRRKCVWIFDALDEATINTQPPRDISRTSLFRTNRLSEWPNAKFIFSFKRNTADPRQFAQGVTTTPPSLLIDAFGESKIFNYLQRYVNEKKKKPSFSIPWSYRDYEAHFKKMQQTELWRVITNPFRLRVTADVFPLLVRKCQEKDPSFKIEEMFKDLSADVIARKLFRVFACVSALRSSGKTLERGFKPGFIAPEKYLEYSAALAERMQDLGVRSVPWPSADPAIKANFGDLFENKEPMYKECLIYRQEGWSFMHNDYRTFFITLGQDEEQLERAIKELEEYKLYKEWY